MNRGRIALVLALFLLILQLAFTALVRGYVVPHLTPTSHWAYGLAKDSDSQVFHETAVLLADRMRLFGWDQINHEQFEGMTHTKILASLYFLSGSDSPYLTYVLNALLLTGSGLLVFALLLRRDVRPVMAALGSAIVTCGPMVLFAHSEVLREPFILPMLLVFVLGLLAMLEPMTAAGVGRWRQMIAGGALVMIGFAGAVAFRPYLMLPLIIALALSAGVVIASVVTARSRSVFSWHQTLALLAITVALVFLYVLPRGHHAQQYSDESVTGQPSLGFSSAAIVINERGEKELVDLDRWRAVLAAKKDKRTLTRADFMVPHWCTVEWKHSAWVPGSIDGKLQAMACARQDYLRFCDESLLGLRADRGCDSKEFESAMDVVLHVPRAVFFALFVPFPDMWLNSFGSGGTGLRRIGYVIDGIVDYTLLAGLVLCASRLRRSNPEILVAAAALVAMLTIYGLAVPTQFVLARLRLGMFTPLLALGAAGWLRWLQDRRAQPEIHPLVVSREARGASGA